MSGTSLRARITQGVQAAGVRKSLWLVATAVFFVLGVAASAIEVTGIDTPGIWLPIVLVVSGVVVGVVRLAKPASLVLRVPNSRTRVVIRVGDLFEINAHKAIGTNVHFDSTLGAQVAPNSLHGQAITKLFGGDSARFKKEVEASLLEQQATGETVEGHERPRYPIGTTPVVDVGPKKLFLPAICHTELPSFKATADVDDLWVGLCSLWRSVRNGSNGLEVAIPLMGSGQAQVRLSNTGLLRLILMSIVHESAEHEITKQITIILTKEGYQEIDLSSVSLE